MLGQLLYGRLWGDTMNINDVKVCVLRIEGTNCEDETYEAFKMLGSSPEKVHLKQLTSNVSPSLKRTLEDYDVLAFPGGFSAGDYIRAGAIFAARMKSALSKDLERFVDSGKPILGICNGFQVLVELGLLPSTGKTMSDLPQAALYTNDSARFECRPTYLRHDNKGKCALTANIPFGTTLMIPSAHAEGNLKFPSNEEEKYISMLEENDQIVFRYTNPSADDAEYPWCPNGSVSQIAGICNSGGNVLGLMPHPERVMYRYQHPDWTRSNKDPNGPGDGREIFMSVIDLVSKS